MNIEEQLKVLEGKYIQSTKENEIYLEEFFKPYPCSTWTYLGYIGSYFGISKGVNNWSSALNDVTNYEIITLEEAKALISDNKDDNDLIYY